jgi:RNA-directed DNA polymerase
VIADLVHICGARSILSYVKTQRAGERVMGSVVQFLEGKLKLRVNRQKIKVDRASKVKFLGFSFYRYREEVRIRVATESLQRFRQRLLRLTRRTSSGKLEEVIREMNQYLRGWTGYFRLADTPSVFEDWIVGQDAG